MRKFIITARLSEEEYRVLTIIERHEGLGQSEVIRLLIREEATRRVLPPGLVNRALKIPVGVPAIDLPVGEVQNADRP
jgi:hypothetical protein